MADALQGIDHLVIAVEDLDRGEAAYRRLGFTLSPRALHSAKMGTANRTIMLERDYFELLAVVAPTDANARWRAALEAGEGLAGCAAATPNAGAARDAWREAGFAAKDIVDFSRPVPRPDGRSLEARFEIVSLPPDALPGMSMFACAHLTRDAVWLPELLQHANTATGIRRLTLALPDPSRAAATWRRALPDSDVAAIAGGIRIRSGRHAIDLLDPATAAAMLGLERPRTGGVAIEFAVADLRACGRTQAEPAEACGVALRFAHRDAPLE